MIFFQFLLIFGKIHEILWYLHLSQIIINRQLRKLLTKLWHFLLKNKDKGIYISLKKDK